ncbi:uncharacterized protein LOC124291790 [Haliotis rubra]|uniref:uncharacterized protein LOC124291790 n=1 Tax=Haliotis rubra TaxID=36100 RepID=UPI001EE54A77|nr:uncharacterized protein LOC124291790 [Haliotis rubra]XP_046584828.1 uncharacterized protein LOC124291790 [Haliotis rubra]XP_046584836.1 uncharacterized protein LOC124291790 [Haliotis rubra]
MQIGSRLAKPLRCRQVCSLRSRRIRLGLLAAILLVVVWFLILTAGSSRPFLLTSDLRPWNIAVSNISAWTESLTSAAGARDRQPLKTKQNDAENPQAPHVDTGTDHTETTTKKVRQFHSNSTKPTYGPRRRYLIYLCDKKGRCGGWGDRQRGIVAAYLLARVTGRRFGINMSHPCDIKKFYIPNMVNWNVNVKDIQGLSLEQVNWMNNRNGVVDVKSDFNLKHPSDVVFFRTNQDIINGIKYSPRYGSFVPKEFKTKKRPQIFQTIWHQLMTPSVHFGKRINKFMSTVPKETDLVCSHVRMRKNPNMPNDASPINALSSVDLLWRFLSKFKNTSRVFVASDSVDVRNSARKWFGNREIDTDGVVLHIDLQGHVSSACIGLEMALLDQAVLSLCKVLVVSTSNFSIRGAMMSKLKQKLFMFKNGTITAFNLS